ncbi:hypothetical protein ACG2LH_15265 [Zhouia sp. PK063]|uniref:hypothetical protein n=1 Tax=Zhouia sp. PK063 TaxID=3373602 RepID=UPI0037AEB86D
MIQSYILAWLDTVISTNFDNTNVHPPLSTAQLQELIRKIHKESQAIEAKLKHRVYAITSEKRIRIFLNNYYHTLEVLHLKVHSYRLTLPDKEKQWLLLLTTLEDTLDKLMQLIQERFENYIHPQKPTLKKQRSSQKVRCNLSTDQAALILRAADESRLLQSKSLRHVFHTITPFLATPTKENLSSDAMRVSAYKAEEKDKDIVVRELQRLIEKVKSY